jgi:hypothetical protein
MGGVGFILGCGLNKLRIRCGFLPDGERVEREIVEKYGPGQE